MKKIILITTIIAAPLMTTSCGDKNSTGNLKSSEQNKSPKEKDLFAKAEAQLKQDIAKQSSKLMLATPHHLKLGKLEKDFKYDEGLQLVTATYTWNWSSDLPLYKKVETLELENNSVSVLEQVKDPGVVAFNGLTVLLSDQGEDQLTVTGQKQTNGSWLDQNFNRLGQLKSEFPNSVVLGTDEHIQTEVAPENGANELLVDLLV